ncbi:MAG: glycoside hydrolase family 55 protein [Akkermansiaceae bacterium]|jgi:hypothetical protein|nr:glycoside hydrolase family 55 protein [Akkermansiaceae bacterium]
MKGIACVWILAFGPALAQEAASGWVYQSPTGNLLYQLDERGQRIADFSQCGYRGGIEPLPDVRKMIPQDRWVKVSPADGDDRANIQAAIQKVSSMSLNADGWRGVVFLNAGEYQLDEGIRIAASGVVLKGAGNDEKSGTRLRATAKRQYTLIEIGGSGGRRMDKGSTRKLTQKLVPSGARSFEVDSAAGYSVGDTVIVHRPSTAEWIKELKMDRLGPKPAKPWTAGSKDLTFDRVITRIDGRWLTVDAPLPQTIEAEFGGARIQRYTWPSRIVQSGIEDLCGISNHASDTDEKHAWNFISTGKLQDGWIRNISARHFGYSAVTTGDGGKWLTIADSQCLDPVSQIKGGRRYSFNNVGSELTLFINNHARGGRHDYVFGGLVPGPNAFVKCTAELAHADSGPHHRWAVGALFDQVRIDGNQLNIRNRGNSGTGHGHTGAYMVVWNSTASGFRVENPPTARNWLIGSVGKILPNSLKPPAGGPDGTFEHSGPQGNPVEPGSLYLAQLHQRQKAPASTFREIWLGDVDQHASSDKRGDGVNADPAWLARLHEQSGLQVDARFDRPAGKHITAFTFDLNHKPRETIVAAALSISLKSTGGTWIGFDGMPAKQDMRIEGAAVRTIEIDTALLVDGRLNVAIGGSASVDFAALQIQSK